MKILSKLSFTAILNLLILQSLNFVIFQSHAQEDKGYVQVNKDARIDELIKRDINANKDKTSVSGYRIQLMASSKRDDVQKLRGQFLAQYPDAKAYLTYQRPYFKLRVGNFTEKLQAQKYLDQVIKPSFAGAFMVADEIELEELK